MSQSSSIEWTDATWNPTRGCTEIAPGCAHCYAKTFAERFRGVRGHPYELGFDPRIAPDKLSEPLKWKKPRRIFVDSMSDLFHEAFSDDYIGKVFDVMAQAARHTFQVLTKRPDEAARLIPQFAARHTARDGSGWPLSNVWIGTSIANQTDADKNIPHLLQIPAAVRFLSVEPLIGPVDLGLGRWVRLTREVHGDGPFYGTYAPAGIHRATFNPHGACAVPATNGHLLGVKPDEYEVGNVTIGWVIVGGESGGHSRPMHPDWARSLRDQCIPAGVPFHFKQWGEWMPIFHGIDPSRNDPTCRIRDGHTFPDGQHMWRVGKKAAGRTLDGREWNEFPEVAR